MAINDVTGDNLSTKPSTDAYREGHDRIFGKPNKQAEAEVTELEETEESGNISPTGD